MSTDGTTLHLPALPGWLKTSIAPALVVLLALGAAAWIQAQTRPMVDGVASDLEETIEAEAATIHERIADVQDEVDGLTDSDQILRDRISANRQAAAVADQEARATRTHVTEASKMAAEQRGLMIEMMKSQQTQASKMQDEIRATNMMIQSIQDRL